MSANFTPNMGEYKPTGSFKFWCQKVLPLVYDDSLSYYETLCKVTAYLNDVIQNSDTLNDNVRGVYEAYIHLQDFVNNYFDTLDVQIEINKKLDEMASDGSLSNLIQPLFDTYKSEVNNIIGTQNNEITVLKNRMDTFTSLPSGSTSGDAELADIRNGANGIIYPTAGDAVRGQYLELNTKTNTINKYAYIINKNSMGWKSTTYRNTNGELIYSDNNWKTRTKIPVSTGDIIEYKLIGNTVVSSISYLNESGFISSAVVAEYNDTLFSGVITVPDNVEYIELSIHWTDEESDLQTVTIYRNEYNIMSKDENLTPIEKINLANNIGNSGKYINTEINIVYDSTLESNGGTYIDITTGKEKTDINWYSSNFIPVTVGCKINCELVGNPLVASIAYYDKNFKYISGVADSEQDRLFTINSEAPNNANYVRFTLYAKYSDFIPDIKNQYITIECLGTYNAINVRVLPTLSEVNIAFLGDSITEQAIYVNDIKEITNCNVFNYGVSGTGYLANNVSNRFITRVNGISNDSDIIFIFGGVNDFGVLLNNETRNFNVGNINDASGAETMYGQCKALYEAILTRFPTKKVGIATPLKFASVSLAQANNYIFGRDVNSFGETMEQFVNAIKECAKLYSIPVLDLYKTSGYCDITIPYLTDDGLHPNSVGAEKISKPIYEFLMSL